MLGRAFALPIAVLSSAVLSLTGCEGPRTKRDIKAPAREMTYDDACGLQDYFDERQASSIPAPAAADESVATSAEGK
ncbi:MAG: hypothetical protein ACXWP4_09430, partial [Polyangiales bacterium]